MAAVPPGLACPYHAPTLSLAGGQSPASNLPPMIRFAECVWSELPFGILKLGSVGTAVSGGCICTRRLTQEPDGLALELDAILEAYGVNADNSTDQP